MIDLHPVVIHVHSVYLNKLCQQVVADVAEESMKAAVERAHTMLQVETGEVRVPQKKFIFIFTT